MKLQTNTQTVRGIWQLPLFKEEEEDDEEEEEGISNMKKRLKRPFVSDRGRADSGPQKTKETRFKAKVQGGPVHQKLWDPLI